MDPSPILTTSFPLPRLLGVRVRANWLILLVVLFDLVGSVSGWFWFVGDRWPWWLVPAIIPLLWLAHMVHEAGHVLMARLVGGRVRGITLQMFVGGINDFDVPERPGPLVLYALGGMLGNLLLLAAAYAVVRWGPQTTAWEPLQLVCGYLAYVSARQLWLNLLFPIFPCDAGLLWRAALWPLIGLPRAVKVTIVAGYVSVALVIGAGIVFQSMLWMVLGVSLLFGMVREHQSIRSGFDPWLRMDPAYVGGRSHAGFFARWAERRRRRAAERRERQEAAEQEVLDRLLAKVSEHGLPSLTADERSMLERISRRQRERQGT